MPEGTKYREVLYCTYSSETSAANDGITGDAVEKQVLAGFPVVLGELGRVEDGGTILVHITGVDCVDGDRFVTLHSPVLCMSVIFESRDKARSAPVAPVDMLVNQVLKTN